MDYNGRSVSMNAIDNTEMIFGPWKECKLGTIDLATPAPPPGFTRPAAYVLRLLDDGNDCIGFIMSALAPRLVRTAGGLLHAAQWLQK